MLNLGGDRIPCLACKALQRQGPRTGEWQYRAVVLMPRGVFLELPTSGGPPWSGFVALIPRG